MQELGDSFLMVLTRPKTTATGEVHETPNSSLGMWIYGSFVEMVRGADTLSLIESNDGIRRVP